MTAPDLFPLLPLLVLAAAPIVVLLVTAVGRSHGLVVALTLAGLALAFASLWVVAPLVPRQVTSLLVVDRYALFYVGLLVAAAFAVTLFAHGYLDAQDINREEFYVLLLVATLGSAVLACSSHFASFFLGLEVLSVSLYALVAYLCERSRPVEAGLKYLVLAAASAAFLLFGMALLYAATGTMEFERLARAVEIDRAPTPLVAAGTILLITGIGFKLAVVPFHMWTPDVYEGAPAPVTALVATVSKGGMFALLLRYFTGAGRVSASVFAVFSIVAILSMFAGNLLALRQGNVKRILAYSSIAHLGYLLVAFLAGGPFGTLAATYYLIAYFVTILGAFGVVTIVSGNERDADDLDDYRGLFWRRPTLAVVFSAMLLSLAGIPVTAGFLGKFYVVAAGANASAWALVISLVVSSTIGLFYYLRVLAVMFEALPSTPPATPARSSLSGTVALAGLTILLVWIGVAPGIFVNAIRAAVASLSGA